MNTKENNIKEIIISDEQAQKFAEELYYSCDLISDIKKCIEEHRNDYEKFLQKERKNKL